MALIKCPECQEKVSNKAKACPHCGAPAETLIVKRSKRNMSMNMSCGESQSPQETDQSFFYGLGKLIRVCVKTIIYLFLAVIIFGIVLISCAEIGAN